MRTPPPTSRRRPVGFTLTELMVAIAIFAVASMAATSLLFATINTNRYIQQTSDGISQSELAFRRIVEYVRSATELPQYSPISITSPYSTTDVGVATPLTKTVSGNLCTLKLEFLFDPQRHTLTEIGRWMTSAGTAADAYATVLATNVTAFSVTAPPNQPSGSLLQYNVALTIDDGRPITRAALVAVRSRTNP